MTDPTPQDTRWLSAEEQETWLAIREFMWGYPAALDRQNARDSGLSTGEYSVLATLSEAEGHRLRAGDAAADLGWERSRLSHLLRRMEGKGLIERVTSTCDGRGQDVLLTEAGWDAIRTAAPDHVTFVRETIFDPLTAEEQAVLAGALRKIREATQEHGLW